MVDMPLNNIPITTTPESFEIKVRRLRLASFSVLYNSPTLEYMLVWIAFFDWCPPSIQKAAPRMEAFVAGTFRTLKCTQMAPFDAL